MIRFPRIREVHFVGIGGIGMSGIAEVLINLGYRVSGSDLEASATTRRLERLGATVRIGHREENAASAHVVVVSSAVSGQNPEVLWARSQKIPVIPRAEMLAELMRMKYGLAVGGSHGKTTVTSMLAACLAKAGLDPTVVIGGKLNSLGTNAKLGQGAYLVAEADESDGTFLKLTPTIAIVTNIDPEHLDFYGSFDAICDAFTRFVNQVPFYGTAVLCMDDPDVCRIIPQVTRRVVTYGQHPEALIRAEDITFNGPSSRFVVLREREVLGEVWLGMPGRHNVVNALAAIAASLELEIPFDAAVAGLRRFQGVQRRFQRKGEVDGVLVVDDYGHHPSEIRATLEAARSAYPDRQLVVLFQPHRYSRTQALMGDFAHAFGDADRLLVTDIYPAGEAAVPGVSGKVLTARIKGSGHPRVDFVSRGEDLQGLLKDVAGGTCTLLTLGAGDIWREGEAFLKSRGAKVEGSQA